MTINYGNCSVCHLPMIIKEEDEGPHPCHEEECFFDGHETYFDEEDSAESEIDCHCDFTECHPECCPICIDMGYSIYDQFKSPEKDG